MTRKSKREIERDIERLADDPDTTSSELMIVWQDDAGDYYADGDHEIPIEPGEVDALEPLMIISETVVETDWTPGATDGA